MTDTGRWTWLGRHDVTDTVTATRQYVKGHYRHKDSVHLSDRRLCMSMVFVESQSQLCFTGVLDSEVQQWYLVAELVATVSYHSHKSPFLRSRRGLPSASGLSSAVEPSSTRQSLPGAHQPFASRVRRCRALRVHVSSMFRISYSIPGSEL